MIPLSRLRERAGVRARRAEGGCSSAVPFSGDAPGYQRLTSQFSAALGVTKSHNISHNNYV